MKTRGPIWKVSISTTSEAEEAVTELLFSFFEIPVSSYTDVETGEVTVATYLAGGTSAPPGKDADALRERLKEIEGCGLEIGSGKVSLKKVPKEDWAESWKRHFKPIEIGSALLIKPSWIKRQPKKGQAVIVLDPGLSFGTGQHATTGFCLRQIVAHQKSFRRSQTAATKSVLDIGSGSGILAIAAAKLGYAPVEAFDFDPEAVRIARENARKNRVLQKIHIARGDVTKLPLRSHKKYDLICANLISTLLIGEQARILARLKPEGVLVVAGILNNEFHLVQTAYEGAGLKLIASRVEKEWRSGTFTYRRPG